MDEIPHVDDDPISRLYAHYFLKANILYKYNKRLGDERSRKGKLSRNKELEEFHIRTLWLASLQVVCEGFAEKKIQKALTKWKNDNRTISMHCGSIEHKMGQLGNELRTFRNATFHYQPTAEKHLKFLLTEGRYKPFHWAEELHKEFAMLFSAYRVERCAQYIIQQSLKDSR